MQALWGQEMTEAGQTYCMVGWGGVVEKEGGGGGGHMRDLASLFVIYQVYACNPYTCTHLYRVLQRFA